MKKLTLGIFFILVITTFAFSQSFTIESSLSDTILYPQKIKTFGSDIYVLCNANEPYDTTYGIPYEGSLPFGSYIYVFDNNGNEKYHHFYQTSFTYKGIEEQSYGSAKRAKDFYLDDKNFTIPFTVYNMFSMCNNNPNIAYENSKPGFIKADKNKGDTLIFRLCTNDSSDCPISYNEITSAIVGDKLMLLYKLTTVNGDSMQLVYRDFDNFDIAGKRSAYFNTYIDNAFFDEQASVFISMVYDNVEKKGSIVKFDTTFNTNVVIDNLNLLGLQDWSFYKTIKSATDEYVSIFLYYDYLSGKRHSILLKYTSDGTVLLNAYFDDMLISDLIADQSGNIYGIQQFLGSRPWDAPGYRLLLFDDTLGIVSWKDYSAGTENSISIDEDGDFCIAGSKFWNLTVVKDNVSILNSVVKANKNNNSFFQISPNPVNHYTTLTLSNPSKGFSLKIYDSKGILCQNHEFENCSQTIIDVHNLGAGLYFLNVTDYERNTSTRKMIIK